MEALALLFGLFLVVLLGIASLAAILAALQGLTLAINADKTLAVLSVLLVFPAVIFGVVYWLKGTDLPGKLMDDLREKHRRDSEEAEQPKPDDHHEPDGNGPAAGRGDTHDNVDHHLIDHVRTDTRDTTATPDTTAAGHDERPFVSEVTEGEPIKK